MTWTGEYFMTQTTTTDIAIKGWHITSPGDSRGVIFYHQHLYRVYTGGVYCAGCGDELRIEG